MRSRRVALPVVAAIACLLGGCGGIAPPGASTPAPPTALAAPGTETFAPSDGAGPGTETFAPSDGAGPGTETFAPSDGAGPSEAVAPSEAGAPSGAGRPASAGLASFRHVYLLVLENKEYGQVVGNRAAPFLNGLISRYATLSRMSAETHPSEPNYLALFSGSTQGVTDDGTYHLAGTNLADQLDAHRKTWRVYAQNVPPGCFTGYSASGGADGPGTYARKHEPAISFTNISNSRERCTNITDFSHFDPGAADLELIVPNMCNDMHDCPVSRGDRFLAGFVPRITRSPAFAESVLFITFDEGGSSAHGGGHIATVVVSPLVRAGTIDRAVRNHYSLLRTIEDAWGLGCMRKTCAVDDLGGLFR